MKTRVKTIPSISTMVSTAKYLGIRILHSVSDGRDVTLPNEWRMSRAALMWAEFGKVSSLQAARIG